MKSVLSHRVVVSHINRDRHRLASSRRFHTHRFTFSKPLRRVDLKLGAMPSSKTRNEKRQKAKERALLQADAVVSAVGSLAATVVDEEEEKEEKTCSRTAEIVPLSKFCEQGLADINAMGDRSPQANSQLPPLQRRTFTGLDPKLVPLVKKKAKSRNRHTQAPGLSDEEKVNGFKEYFQRGREGVSPTAGALPQSHGASFRPPSYTNRNPPPRPPRPDAKDTFPNAEQYNALQNLFAGSQATLSTQEMSHHPVSPNAEIRYEPLCAQLDRLKAELSESTGEKHVFLQIPKEPTTETKDFVERMIKNLGGSSHEVGR